ncbi:MAG TPA: gliding motility-associated C-terminal domain-containing protein, partial [Flavipsychrobacter sp.]|nr:gliding motility-associated C-terminal domain-containing protein [Flavipsychrobacter sp.]
GATSYIWLPENSLSYEPDQTPFIRIFKPEEFTVIGKNETGCSDTLTFSYTNIEACCTFSYPTAFTPNGDGKNDTWRPIMYGNYRTYELSLYDRWGLRLFHSFISNEGWDGNYNSHPQSIGTYYYFLKAKCVTGKEEMHKGEFSLLR